jgi:hypothetical protein
MGGGIVTGIDERTYLIPIVKCDSCGHQFYFDPELKAECPACHIQDEWFCAECQEIKGPLVKGDQRLCPTCKAQGRTRGLKRIMKFKVFQGKRFDFQPWIRSGGVEVRVDHGKIKVGPYTPPTETQPAQE